MYDSVNNNISYLRNGGWFMVFNTTVNNISAISWRSFLMMEEDGVPGENHRSVTSHWQTLMLYREHSMKSQL